MTVENRPDGLADNHRKVPVAVPALLAIGELLAGRYRIVAALGGGGMGQVFEAYDICLERRVAVKLIDFGRHPSLPVVQRNLQARFVSEARSCAKINHPNVVQIYDVVELPDGTTFLVMELVEGISLADKLRDEGAVPFDEARTIIMQALDGLSATHRVGVIHRDLKPGNIMLVQGHGPTKVKIIDFGIGKYAGGDDGGLTSAGAAMGSPLYASPEQWCDAGSVDLRTDVYALGAVFYELLAGHPPFEGGTSAVRRMHFEAPRPRVPDKGASVWMTKGIDAFIQRAMSIEPDQRYENAMQMRHALLNVMMGVPDDPTRCPEASPNVVPARRVKWARVMVGVLIVIAGIIGARVLSSRHSAAGSKPVQALVVPEDAGVAPVRIVEPVPTAKTIKDGCDLTNAGKYPDAIVVLQEALNAAPDDFAGWYCLGRAASYVADGDPLATKAYRTLLGLRPKNATAQDKIAIARATAWLKHHER